MDNILHSSQEIFADAVVKHPPHAVVLALSGGTDSLTALAVALKLNIKIDYILHCNTRTGIKQTTEYVRNLANDLSIPYIEADSGDAYEEYVRRKGFFGRGNTAHNYAYHVLKATAFRKAVSKVIRKRKRGRNVLLLNGARLEESDNRRENMGDSPLRVDPGAKSNIWVNILQEWTKRDCMKILMESFLKRNPVADILHRSGECMCGTTQSDEAREEAAFWFPEWGAWINNLEADVTKEFPWKWGQQPADYERKIMKGQMPLFSDFNPMCHTCSART